MPEALASIPNTKPLIESIRGFLMGFALYSSYCKKKKEKNSDHKKDKGLDRDSYSLNNQFKNLIL